MKARKAAYRKIEDIRAWFSVMVSMILIVSLSFPSPAAIAYAAASSASNENDNTAQTSNANASSNENSSDVTNENASANIGSEDASGENENSVSVTTTMSSGDDSSGAKPEKASASAKGDTDKISGSEKEDDKEKEAVYEAGAISAELEEAGYTVNIEYTADAKIPAGSKVSVSQIEDEDEEKYYSDKLDDALKLGDDEMIAFASFLDISIVDKNGDEVKPAVPVSVEIKITDKALPAGLVDAEGFEDSLSVVHFDDKGEPEKIDTKSKETKRSSAKKSVVDPPKIVFETDSFSVFSITSIVRELADWITDYLRVKVYALLPISATLTPQTDVSVERGMEVLEAYKVSGGSRFWLKWTFSQQVDPGKYGSVGVYETQSGSLVDEIPDYALDNSVKYLNLDDADGFALVKDTGLRYKTFEADPGAGQHVEVAGMAPVESEAAIDDVFAADDREHELAAYDITITDRFGAFQPAADSPMTVNIANEAVAKYIEKGGSVDVIHIADDGTETPVESVWENGLLTFEADGFSVYIIVEHEGDGAIETPRVEFHFIDKEPTETAGGYTSGPYNFPNKANEYQASQILKDGENLEMIANPPTITIVENGVTTEKFFYGWYDVEASSDSTRWDAATQRWTGSIVYAWPADPQKFEFEVPISIETEDETPEVGEELTWTFTYTVDDETYTLTGTGTMDANGKVDVYLAPIYEDFFFVNFRLGALNGNDDLSQNLLTRKLVVFGSTQQATLRIGDVKAPSSDPQHQVFVGWESVKTENGQVVRDQYYATVDAEGNEVNSPGSTDGYYITINEPQPGDDNYGKSYYDLYPVFAEARWIYFNTGKSGNGATYVPARYRLTDDEGIGTTYTGLNPGEASSSRNGYALEGWYIDVVQDTDGNIDNLSSAAPITLRIKDDTVSAGDTVSNVSMTNGTSASATVSEDGVITITATATAQKLLNADGTLAVSDGFKKQVTYTVNGETKTVTLYEVKNGELYFYKALDDLTVYANWVVNATTTYKVIIWKQKVTDHVLATDDQKTYDYEIYYVSNPVSSAATVTPTNFSGTYTDTTGTHNAPTNLTNISYTGFQYNASKSDMTGTPAPDGSTVYNIYYDRIAYTLTFQNNSGNTYNWTETTSDGSGLYGLVEGHYQMLDYIASGYSYSPSYSATTVNNDTDEYYGIVNGQYVLLDVTEVEHSTTEITDIYKLTSTPTDGNQLLIVNSNTSGNNKYALQRNNNSVTRSSALTIRANDQYTNAVWIDAADVNENAVLTVGASGNNRYTFSNGGSYLYTANNSNTLSFNTTSANWTWNSTNNRLSSPRGTNYNLRYANNSWSVNNSTNSVYLYEKTTREVPTTTYTYECSYNGQPYTGIVYSKSNSINVYTGTRYTKSGNTYTPTTEDGDGQYGLDANGVYVALSYNASPIYTYVDSNGNTQQYPYTRFTRSNGTASQYRTIYEIKALYGQNISSNFPITDWNGTTHAGDRWSPQNSQLYNQVLVFIETMPNENTTFRLSTSTASTKHMYLYVEPLPGQTGTTRTYNNKEFILYRTIDANYNFFTEAEDYPDLTGFSKSSSYAPEGYNNNGQKQSSVWNNSNATNLYCYYLRDTETFTFNVNYPDVAGVTFDGVAADDPSCVKSDNRVESVLFEAPLNSYGSTSSGGVTNWYYGVVDENNTATNELIAPDHYIFGGWYEDETCTVPFNFDSTMPAANKIVYAKWTPETFRVKIDPNGAEIDHINHNTYPNGGYSGYEGFPMFNRDAIAGERAADSGYNRSQATYINATYNTTLSEYTVSREYVPISDEVASSYEGQIYYYINTQYVGENIDGVPGLPSDNRNAIYVTDNGLEDSSNEMYRYWQFHNAWIQGNLDGGYISGTQLLDYGTWKSLYVQKQDPSNPSSPPQKFRKVASNEHYEFLGWYQVRADGTTSSMPYVFSDPVTEPITIRAMWRLDGGYKIQYHADYYTSDGVINGTMAAWIDPESDSDELSYADGAPTQIYKAPYEITLNGEPTDEYIFRGFRLVSVGIDGQGNPTYTPLEPGVFYDPGDPFVVQASLAVNGIIHMQAVYEAQDSAYRRPYVTNLTLDANGGYLTTGSGYDSSDQFVEGSELEENTDLTASSGWSGIGTVSATKTYTDDQGVEHSVEWIEFGDIQSDTAVHLYQYATTLRTAGDVGVLPLDPYGTNYFAHPDDYFLLGFDDDPNEGDFIATYPADAVISVQRQDDEIIYAVWEPMVYLNLVNETDEDLTLAVSSPDNLTLYILNEVTGIYSREVVQDLNNIEVPANGKITLSLPYGAEKMLSISGTNTLGTGKVLTWDTSLTVDNTTYDTAVTGANVNYHHVDADAGIDDTHVLVKDEADNTQPFSFDEKLIVNPDGLTVTFDTYDSDYALVLDDNYPATEGAKIVEHDYDAAYVAAHNSQELPSTNTRPGGWRFLGWALDPDATVPDYAAAENWEIDDLATFFANAPTTTANDGTTTVATLYAVWDRNENPGSVYVYKDVPSPGNQNTPFDFTLSLRGEYRRNNSSSWQTLSQDVAFQLQHGDYAVIESGSQVSGGYIKADLTIYKADGTVRVATQTYQVTANNPSSSGSFQNINIGVTDDLVKDNSTVSGYYSVSASRTAQANNGQTIHVGNSPDTTTLPLTLDDDDSFWTAPTKPSPNNLPNVYWTDTSAGGTVVFTNTRAVRDITVQKTLVSNTSTPGTFPFTASYIIDGDTEHPVSWDFSVTSGVVGHVLEDMPVGAVLTITEHNDGSYITQMSAQHAVDLDSLDPCVFKMDVTQDDTVNVTNTLKSYPVKLVKVDQNGQTTVNAMFSLTGPTGSLGSDLYASPANRGVFYDSATKGNLYVGSYTLTETVTPSGYRGLGTPVTIDVTGSGVSCVSDYVSVGTDPDVPGGYIVNVFNQQIANVTVAKVLEDPLLSQREFDFTATYSYTLNGKPVTTTETLSFMSNDTATVTVPVGAQLTITEQNTAGSYDVYDTTYKVDNGAYEPGVANYTYSTASVAGSEVVTFKNTRKVANITVTKIVDSPDPASSGTFDFTALLQNGSIPISNWTMATGYVTDSTGYAMHGSTSGFSLSHGQSIVLQIPYASKLTITEASSSEYETSVAIGQQEASAGQSITLTSAQTHEDLTVTFTNAMVTVAPTSRPFASSPYGLMFAAGVLLVICVRRSRHASGDEEGGENA